MLLFPVDFLLDGTTPGGGGGGALVCDGGPLGGMDPGIGGTRLVLLVKPPGVVGNVGEGISDPRCGLCCLDAVGEPGTCGRCGNDGGGPLLGIGGGASRLMGRELSESGTLRERCPGREGISSSDS